MLQKKSKRNNNQFWRTSTPIQKRLANNTLPSFAQISGIRRKSCGNKFKNSFKRYFRVKKRTVPHKSKSNLFIGSYCESIDDESTICRPLAISGNCSKKTKPTLLSTPFKSNKVFNQEQVYSQCSVSNELDLSQYHSSVNHSLASINNAEENNINISFKEEKKDEIRLKSSTENNSLTSQVGKINRRLQRKKKRMILTKHSFSNSDFTQVKRSPLSFLERKRKQALLLKKDKIARIAPVNLSSKETENNIKAIKESQPVLPGGNSKDLNSDTDSGSNFYKDTIVSNRKNLSSSNKIDDISSGMYGGNLNLTVNNILQNNSKWDGKERSRILRMSLPVSVPHGYNSTIRSLKKALDDICYKYIDGPQSLQNVDAGEIKSKTRKLGNKESNCKKNEATEVEYSSLKAVDEEKIINLTDNKERTKIEVTSKKNRSHRIKKTQSLSVPVKEKEKLNLIEDFKTAWENSQKQVFSHNKASKETVEDKNEGSGAVREPHVILHNTPVLAESENVLDVSLTSQLHVSNGSTSSNRSSSNVIKKHNVSRKGKPKGRKVLRKGTLALSSEPNDDRRISIASEMGVLDEIFTYPYTSTPLNSPETGNTGIPLIFQSLSPVVEEISANRLSGSFIETPVLYENRTYGKCDVSSRNLREDKLWLSVCDSDYSFSSKRKCNSNLEQTEAIPNSYLGASQPKSPSHLSIQINKTYCLSAHETKNITRTQRSVKTMSDKLVSGRTQEFQLDYKEGTAREESTMTDLADHFEEVSKWELYVESVVQQK